MNLFSTFLSFSVYVELGFCCYITQMDDDECSHCAVLIQNYVSSAIKHSYLFHYYLLFLSFFFVCVHKEIERRLSLHYDFSLISFCHLNNPLFKVALIENLRPKEKRKKNFKEFRCNHSSLRIRKQFSTHTKNSDFLNFIIEFYIKSSSGNLN